MVPKEDLSCCWFSEQMPHLFAWIPDLATLITCTNALPLNPSGPFTACSKLQQIAPILHLPLMYACLTDVCLLVHSDPDMPPVSDTTCPSKATYPSHWIRPLSLVQLGLSSPYLPF